MRILFYLPVITPWWFDAIVVPLVSRLAADHEVHILAPVLWQGTGIGAHELAACAHLPQVRWHLIDDETHPTMRTAPAERAGIIAFVHSLAPDYVLCRSADCDTVAAFPGVVRHMMEGGAAPFAMPNHWIVLQERPFDHGLLPDLDSGERAVLDLLIAPEWDASLRATETSIDSGAAFRSWAGLPGDRPVLVLPLEYEHAENFFPIHRVGAAPNARLVEELADSIDESFFLAITNHPLNEQHVDNHALQAVIESHGERMRLLPGRGPDGANTTMLLTREADGILLGDSKSYSMAGFLGTPILRRSRFATGDWLNAYADLQRFLPAIAQKRAVRPDQERARTWFAYHIANNVLDPADPELTGADILARLDRPVAPERWAGGIARFAAVSQVRR